jgi:cytochrome c biogenesis protein CcmG/thiol:disulfide interchange protein DsbE
VVEHPELDAFQKEHEKTGDATVVSVIYDDDPDDAAAFFERQGGDWPVVLDDSGISAFYGVTKVPETYLVNPDGRVVKKLIGGVTQEGLEAYMAGGPSS